MQTDWSMANGSFILPLMALTGQFLAHFEQPLQTSGKMR